MRALVLGGTKFLGIALTEALLARGHEVAHFNRGQTRSEPVIGVRTFRGDRTLDLSALEAQQFDAVIDTSGYLPHVVERSARFFEGRTGRYVFISSISVYDLKSPALHEDSPMLRLPDDASLSEMTDDTYGPLKALCERVVANTFRQRATIVRPGLIVGPNDPTDRFTYWPLRFARGGDVLVPGTPEREVQFVDVRDVAAFVADAIERESPGEYNVTSPQGEFTMCDVISWCQGAGGASSSVTWVDDAFLVERGVEPWTGLPLWVPPSLGLAGFLNTNVRKAQDAGLTIRPLAQTVADTLSWALTRPRDYAMRAGMTAEREASLLEEFRAKN